MENILEQVRSAIQVHLNTFEEKRTEFERKGKKAKRISLYLLMVMVGILAISIFYFPYQSSGGPFPRPDFMDWLMMRIGIFLVLLFTIFLVFALMSPDKERKRLEETFKNKIFKSLVWVINSNAAYHPKHFFSPDSLEQSNFFDHGIDEVEGEDYFTGEMNDKKYFFSEIEAFNIDKTGENERRSLVFKGLFVDTWIESRIDGGIMIMPKAFSSKKNQDLKVFIGGGEKKVITSPYSSSFGSYYEIVANDFREVEEFLKPELVRILCHLKEEMGYDVKMNVGAGKAYVAISHTKFHDFFSIDYNKPLDKTLVHHSHKKSKVDILDEGITWTDTQLQDLIDEVSLYFELLDVLTK
ncbi:MAG: DUF3137 domain-containing protein [Aureispira sp.]|nr:DUF3137 domain-containing protein [Aureispira sp.]